jgi:hypothetical protein
VPVVLPTTNAGTITACGTSASQFINYTLDGVTYNLTAPADSLMGFTSGQGQSTTFYTNISGMGSNTSTDIHFSFQSPSQTAGSFPMQYLAVNNLDSIRNTNAFSVNITNFPTSTAGFYEGNFSGQFTDLQNATHTISATFRVRRRQ